MIGHLKKLQSGGPKMISFMIILLIGLIPQGTCFVSRAFFLSTPASSGIFLADARDATKSEQPPAPILNGKRVLPYKVMAAGLKGHKVAAVYAVMNSQYKRGTEGWYSCEYVGTTNDLNAALRSHINEHGEVANVRALSFTFPEPTAMEDVANQWRDLAKTAGGSQWKKDDTKIQAEASIDDDDDDDYGDMEISAEAMAAMWENSPTVGTAVISPFEAQQMMGVADKEVAASTAVDNNNSFTKENVDKVLDEVRPYLIADGGNVSVDRVDEEERNVYLVLEGACGSCPSSTVTMQMGIERVLKENFPDLNQVLQVEDDDEPKPTELTWQAVEDEVNRIKPAIVAMGGVVEVVKVDPIGVAELKFRGSNKVRQGLELAILDVPFVKHVKFVMGDDD